MELDDQTKAAIEAMFTTRFNEQEACLRTEAQVCEESWIEQEKIYTANDATVRATVKSLSGQLRQATLEKPRYMLLYTAIRCATF